MGRSLSSKRQGICLAAAIFLGMIGLAAAAEHAEDKDDLSVAKARNLPFCEIVTIAGKGTNRTAQFYNTTSIDNCPPAKFRAIDTKKLAQQINADAVILIPRRHWAADRLMIHGTGEPRDFAGVKAQWTGTMPAEILRAGLRYSFRPMEIHRRARFVYEEGKPAYLLRAPGGKVYVLQSFTNFVEKGLTRRELPDLAGRLSLPAGWTYQVRMLPKDLVIDTTKPGGSARLLQDNLNNIYQACDAACSYVP